MGSARLVGHEPHALSSLSVFLQYDTQLLFRESRASSSGASICMSKLPARVLAAVEAAQRRAAAAAGVLEETAEGDEEVEVREEEEAAAEGKAEGEAKGEAAGGQDWSGAREAEAHSRAEEEAQPLTRSPEHPYLARRPSHVTSASGCRPCRNC